MSKASPHTNGRHIFNLTQLPVVAHNRYWSHKVIYAKQNGGKFTFLMDGTNSIPNDQSFWDYLFSSALQWGMVVYEQDFLNVQSEKILPLYTDLSLGQQWLQQMGEAASRYGIQLQYCMALPRHLLASLEVPAVSQVRVRVSGDYMFTHQQYHIGHTSLFAHALGLAPFKDNFWTTGVQPGNPGNKTELNPFLQAVVALLSMGPVGVGDRIGLSNVTLIQRLITADGRLLKPSKPATPIDKQILQETFGGSVGPVGQVWTTYSDIGSWRYGIIFSLELQRGYHIHPDEAGFGHQFVASVVYSYKTEMEVKRFSGEQPLLLQGCTYTDVCLYYTAPVHKWRSQEVALLGELSKLVPVSPQRVTDIAVSSSDIQVTLKGSPTELVNFTVYVSKETWQFKCVISKYGTATLSVADRSCN
ncbi:hypothetical protein LSAT2_021487 [Lamellibrachia satsuma]|nr:hypothetical protein LSAT2_021487 [Lamellibrachia satsuma]